MLRAACSQSQPQQHNRTLTRSSRVAPTPRDVKESSHQTVDANPTVSNGYCQQWWRGWLAHGVHHTPGVALPHQPSELHNTCKQMEVPETIPKQSNGGMIVGAALARRTSHSRALSPTQTHSPTHAHTFIQTWLPFWYPVSMQPQRSD